MSLVRHVCDTGCKADRDPACEPDSEAKVPLVAAAAIADNPLPVDVPPPFCLLMQVQLNKIPKAKVVEQAGQQVIDEEEGEEGEVEVVC